MSCEDIPSLLDLQKAKLNVDDLGRLMGTGTGTSTNEVTGQVRPTYNAVMANLGYTRVGTFAAGATLLNGRQTLLWGVADGGDGQEYGWSGSFPPSGKVIPPGSTPLTTGGIAVGAWMSRFDPALSTQVLEALRRSYAEMGYNVVGTFRGGFTIVNANDVGVDETTGKGFTGPAGTVAAGTNPITGGFTDVTNSIAAAAGGPLAFSTVDDMKNMRPLGLPSGIIAAVISNLMARTISYHPGWAAMVDPVGGATYTLTTLTAVRAVRGAGWIPDGYVDHYLTIGDGTTYVAVILTGDTISIEQAGAVPNNPAVDNYNSIQAALDWASSAYGRARDITAGVGDFYYSKTLLIKSLQPNFGICPGIVGAGWNRTYFIKTANTPADGALDYSVDAYFSYETRHPSNLLYTYSSKLKHFTCKSTATNKHAYGIYNKLMSHMAWTDVEVTMAEIGVYSVDAWLIEFKGVRARSCGLGFKINGTGTTLNFENTWAIECTDGGYDIKGVVYAQWSDCAADKIFDPNNPTANKVAYKFTNCQGIAIDGCGTEASGEAFYIDNSIIDVTAFRVNSMRLGAAGQTLIRAVNGAGGKFNTCGFTSVPATSAIAVQSRDSASHLSFQNCAFQIANSAVPNDSVHRRNGLTTSMPLDVQGLKTARVPMNGPAWKPITALKSGCGFQLISGVAESADRYIVLSKPYWAYSEISTNSASPTTIGFLANAAGANQTSLRAYRSVETYGVEMLQFSFTGEVVITILFSLQTAQHW